MNPVSPIIPDANLREFTFGKSQEEYDNLPAYSYDDAEGTILSRWKLSFWERLRVMWTGDICLFVQTFRKPLQPVMLQAERPIIDPRRSSVPP